MHWSDLSTSNGALSASTTRNVIGQSCHAWPRPIQAALCWDDPVTISNSMHSVSIGSNTTFSRNTRRDQTPASTLAPLVAVLQIVHSPLTNGIDSATWLNFSTSDNLTNQDSRRMPGLAAVCLTN